MYKDIREKYIEKEEEFRQEAEIHKNSFRKIGLKNQRYIKQMQSKIRAGEDQFGELTPDQADKMAE